LESEFWLSECCGFGSTVVLTSGSTVLVTSCCSNVWADTGCFTCAVIGISSDSRTVSCASAFSLLTRTFSGSAWTTTNTSWSAWTCSCSSSAWITSAWSAVTCSEACSVLALALVLVLKLVLASTNTSGLAILETLKNLLKYFIENNLIL
jgi:hypothetical protein